MRGGGRRGGPPVHISWGAHQPPLCPCERGGLCRSSQDKTLRGGRFSHPNTPHIQGAQAPSTLHPWSPFGVTGVPAQPRLQLLHHGQARHRAAHGLLLAPRIDTLVHAVASMCLHPGGLERGMPTPRTSRCAGGSAEWGCGMPSVQAARARGQQASPRPTRCSQSGVDRQDCLLPQGCRATSLIFPSLGLQRAPLGPASLSPALGHSHPKPPQATAQAQPSHHCSAFGWGTAGHSRRRWVG